MMMVIVMMMMMMMMMIIMMFDDVLVLIMDINDEIMIEGTIINSINTLIGEYYFHYISIS
jgi:hypothetical protein